uniref:Uncharacterized protein n=1 Tax=Timema douglasi TaxID=61478 RepID=A0A7R8VI75_TIMDO|nr:unnamed protein product [Timema douglasi]
MKYGNVTFVKHDKRVSKCSHITARTNAISSIKLPDILNQRDDRGDLPLNLALCEKQTSITLTLVEHNVDLNARDSHGRTLLHLATERADCYSARFLVDHGASLSIATPDTLGNTALHIVASSSPNSIKDDILAEMTEVARFMLDKGLDPNIQNKQGLSSLHLCTMAQNKYMFKLLLNLTNNPVDINIRTHDGHTALWYALHLTDTYDESSFAAQLIKKGAIPNPTLALEAHVTPWVRRGQVYEPQCRSIGVQSQRSQIYSSGDSLLHLIVREHMEGAGLFLCSFATNINHTNKENEGVLHIACAQGMEKLVSAMLAKGADPNLQMGSIRNVDIDETNVDEKFVSKQSPLHLAVSNNHEGVIRAIIEYKSGADINICDKNELTLLHQAILKADTETALFLLEKGIDINVVTTQNETPLELSIKSHLPTVVDALCRKGVDTSAPTSTNCCPIWMALESGQEDIAAILVRNGADIDYWSEGPGGCLQTLLHRAIDENNETIANFLIHREQFTINKQIAINNTDDDVDHDDDDDDDKKKNGGGDGDYSGFGCSLNCSRRPGVTGRSCEEAHDKASPLHLCCQWGLTSVVQTLIEHDAAINIKNEELKTPLHVAIENQNPSIISLLLCHPNIDLTLRDKRGLTPFATALTCRNIKAAQAILVKLPTAAEQKSNVGRAKRFAFEPELEPVKFDNKGYNFLHTAIQKGDVESVLFLLSIHVDINSRVQDVTQTPPLHLAAQLGTEMIIRSLLLAGARADDHDAYRQTALHVAAAAGHEAAVSALLQNGSNFNATDSNGDNALHIAAREGHLSVARVLLTESSLDAETVNIKGQNPLHVLSRYSRENSSAMCELFLECMPNYPLNQPDLHGNTALLLAYMKGNGNLCRILVKAGACLGAMNKDGVTIFNYQVATKQLLYRILDHLSQEPTWAESDICLECGVKFGLTMRRHHW